MAIFIIGEEILLLSLLALIKRLTTNNSKFKSYNYMINRLFKSTFLFTLIVILSCGNVEADKNRTQSSSTKNKNHINSSEEIIEDIVVGANQTDLYMPLLHGKKV